VQVAAARRVVLLGMKHSGKTTIGRRLAGRWGCPFHDTDQILEEHQALLSGTRTSTREIYTRLGPEGFFEAEAAALRAFASRLGDGSCVVAAGGRTPLNPHAAGVLRALGLAVLLDVPAEAVWERVARRGIPPFVDPADPRGSFLALAAARDPEYRRFADLVVPLDPAAPADENENRLADAIDARLSLGGEAGAGRGF
jgi:shikimate kinase